jgi:hypothetical protein
MFATLALAVSVWGFPNGPNTLSAWEAANGFKLLFDGKTLNGWTGWRRKDIPKNWTVEDSALYCSWKDDQGDIRTTEEYSDFDLRFDWKVEPTGNSGVFYRATEDHEVPWHTAPEYQLLDNEKASDNKTTLTQAASVYGLYPPIVRVSRGAGEWNEGRIVAKGNHVEHWLNGVKVVSYELGSPDFLARIEKSKFQRDADFGKKPSGFIVVQDHWQKVWFRNLKVKRL